MSETGAVETCEHEINLEQKLNLLVPPRVEVVQSQRLPSTFLGGAFGKCASVVQTLSTDLFQVNAALFYQRLLEMTPKILL